MASGGGLSSELCWLPGGKDAEGSGREEEETVPARHLSGQQGSRTKREPGSAVGQVVGSLFSLAG